MIRHNVRNILIHGSLFSYIGNLAYHEKGQYGHSREVEREKESVSEAVSNVVAHILFIYCHRGAYSISLSNYYVANRNKQQAHNCTVVH